MIVPVAARVLSGLAAYIPSAHVWSWAGRRFKPSSHSGLHSRSHNSQQHLHLHLTLRWPFPAPVPGTFRTVGQSFSRDQLHQQGRGQDGYASRKPAAEATCSRDTVSGTPGHLPARRSTRRSRSPTSSPCCCCWRSWRGSGSRHRRCRDAVSCRNSSVAVADDPLGQRRFPWMPAFLGMTRPRQLSST